MLKASCRRCCGLDEENTAALLRAISIFFDLMNMAEDRHRVRVLHDRERRAGDEPRPESVGAALRHLVSLGYTPEQIQRLLATLDIEPVFTAHPTEAKRRTVRTKLKSIQTCLGQLDGWNCCRARSAMWRNASAAS